MYFVHSLLVTCILEVETLTLALTEVKKPDANGIVALVLQVLQANEVHSCILYTIVHDNLLRLIHIILILILLQQT
jgi:hypothetical protein